MNEYDPRRILFLIIPFALLLIALIMAIQKSNEQTRKQMSLIEKRIAKVEMQVLELSESPQSLMKIIADVNGIISNQTQSIKELKKVAEIQVMSTKDPPVIKEMQPSTDKGVYIDLMDTLEKWREDFLDRPIKER